MKILLDKEDLAAAAWSPAQLQILAKHSGEKEKRWRHDHFPGYYVKSVSTFSDKTAEIVLVVLTEKELAEQYASNPVPL